MKGTLAAQTQVPPMVYGVSEDSKPKKKVPPTMQGRKVPFLTQKMKYCRPVTQSILEIRKNEGHFSCSNSSSTHWYTEFQKILNKKIKKFCPCITDKYFLTQKMKYCRPVTQSILEICKNEGHFSWSKTFSDQLKCPSFLRISNIDWVRGLQYFISHLLG